MCVFRLDSLCKIVFNFFFYFISFLNIPLCHQNEQRKKNWTTTTEHILILLIKAKLKENNHRKTWIKRHTPQKKNKVLLWGFLDIFGGLYRLKPKNSFGKTLWFTFWIDLTVHVIKQFVDDLIHTNDNFVNTINVSHYIFKRYPHFSY